MFWERFFNLCIEFGTRPNPVAKELNISSGVVTKWKNTGALPTTDALLSIADYFGCSLDYLVGRSDVRMHNSQIATNNYFGLSEDESRIIEKYRKLDKDGMDAVRGVLLSEQRRVEARPGEEDSAVV